MTAFGIILGCWLISVAIDRFADKVCAMLSNVKVNWGDITVNVVHDQPTEPKG